MSQVTVSVEIDGQTRNINDCFWTVFAPCGCTSGAMTTRHYVDGVGAVGHITTEDAAWIEFEPNRGVREQEIARGSKMKLIHRDQYMDAMSGNCPHIPMWGGPDIPEDKQWGLASGNRVVHLVDRIDAHHGYSYGTAVCKDSREYFEIGRSVGSEKPMCKKCLKVVAA